MLLKLAAPVVHCEERQTLQIAVRQPDLFLETQHFRLPLCTDQVCDMPKTVSNL